MNDLVEDISIKVFLVVNDVWADLLALGIKTYETRIGNLYDVNELSYVDNRKISIVKWDSEHFETGPKTIVLNNDINDGDGNDELTTFYTEKLTGIDINDVNFYKTRQKIMSANIMQKNDKKFETRKNWNSVGTGVIKIQKDPVTGLAQFFQLAENTLCAMPDENTTLFKEDDKIKCHNNLMAYLNNNNVDADKYSFSAIKRKITEKFTEIKEKNKEIKEKFTEKITEDLMNKYEEAWKRWYKNLINGLVKYNSATETHFREKQIQIFEFSDVEYGNSTLLTNRLYPQYFKAFHSTIEFKNMSAGLDPVNTAGKRRTRKNNKKKRSIRKKRNSKSKGKKSRKQRRRTK